MFERFTDEARMVVVLAQEESRTLRHDYIGTEHLLLGLMHEDGSTGATVLRSLGVTADDVRGEVAEIVGSGTADVAGHIPFTPRAKKVMELSLRESLNQGDREITDAHILLALVREGNGVAMQALTHLHVDPAAVRAAVLESRGMTEREPVRGPRGLFRRAESSPSAPSAHEGASSSGRVTLLEHLDDAAWEALTAARATARRRGAGSIRCTDLLAGVAAVDGAAADILRGSGTDPDALVAAAAALGGSGAEPPGALWLDPLARAALASAVEQAMRSGQPVVTTVHVLAGLFFAVDDELAGLLATEVVDMAAVHAQVAEHLDEPVA